MKIVIYDFNGTVLDDVDICIRALNTIVKKYLVRDEVSLDEYLKVFGFPVIDYYKRVGFDFDKLSFEEVGQEWMDIYDSLKDEYKLHDGIYDQLKENKEKGIHNILLSASRHDKLLAQCRQLGIEDLFDEILGIDNIYATSKVNIAKDWMSKQAQDNTYVLVGDTKHDYEVSKELNIPCILVANGHEAKESLLKATSHVYDDIKEVVNDAYWPK